VVGAVIGFFVPDLLLRRARSTVRTGAAEALLVYIDLVTLERLTNASATQALHNAAALSDVPLFVQIRTALERSRLEQQSPYAELRRLSERLGLPELADIADVMQLDETGAALSGTLRARVRELRDAHLTREQIKASAAAEGMTIYMTLPALIFGLIFSRRCHAQDSGRLMSAPPAATKSATDNTSSERTTLVVSIDQQRRKSKWRVDGKGMGHGAASDPLMARLIRGLGSLAVLVVGLAGVPIALASLAVIRYRAS
jgi:hypothetical protein